ncbi:MAG: T9SS type A sorting domain-containing protein [Ignavibacteria bacterium]
MKKVLSLFQVIVITILITFTFVGISISQMENPNKDGMPESFLKNLPPRIITPMAVVTIDDFDNFNMGTDFAEGHISMNPMNPLQTFNAFNTNGTHYSNDGGLTWFVSNPAFPNAAGDPITAYDSLGNLYYETMKSPITGCWVAKSSNNGQTWLWTNVSATTGNDKNWMCADQTGGPYANYVYTIMTNGSSATVARSSNNGVSFTNTQSLSPHALPGSMVCVGPNGSISGGCVYAVTHSGSNALGTYNFFRSTDGGLTFTSLTSGQWSNVIGTEVSGRSTVSSMRTRPYPMIAADNSYSSYRGRLYCVYASNEPAGTGNKSDVFCRYSTDQGATWSNRVTINDDVNTQNNNQFHTAIWCDKQTGKLYAMWYDTRNCPTNDSIDVYASYSTNGGVSFVPNQRITNKKFRIAFSNQTPPSYQGDYNSIVSNQKTSMVLWADFRNNSYGSYTGYFPDYAMRMNPTTTTINSNNGVRDIRMVVPAVKLYTDTVVVTSTITPAPAAGTFAITYPSPGGNKLKSYPDSLIVRVTAANVTPGSYTLTVTASGPNGTPVHQRTVSITANTTTAIITEEIPNTFKLEQNYPNPFNPVTKIGYSVAKVSDVKISVFNVLGKEVASFVNEKQAPGNHYVLFNANSLTTGVYYYKIEAGEFTDVKKMILMK